MTFQPLRGFRDYPAPDAGARSELRRKMRAVARRSGFQELETPSVESLELFKVKSGEEIGQQVWAFTDKGGREVALLPETTPSLARIFVDRAKSEPMPVKWFTLSKLWRYEEPQQGRTREFGQFNLDILGVPGIEAEVELLATAALLLDEVGARGLYAFRINDRGLAEGLGAHFGVTQPERFLHVLDRFRKLSGSEFHRELREAGVPEAAATELSQLLSAAGPGVPAAQADDLLDRISTLGLPEPGPSAIARLRALVQLVSSAGFADRVVLDPSVARGLAYYTSTVFEAYDLSGDLRALFGGGRYDHLIGLFGGPPTPACGLAVGDQTLELLLRGKNRWPQGEPGLDTYVVAVTANEVPLAIEITHRLRRAGLSADMDLLGRSMSRQLKEADRRRARRALLIGPQEVAKGIVMERDLATGQQTERPLDSVRGPA